MAEVTVEQASRRVRDTFNKAFGAFERGNLDQAMDLFQSCLELEPGLLRARKFLRAAAIRVFKEKGGGRFAHAAAALKGGPTYLNAVRLLKTNKAAQAVLAAEELLRLDPLSILFIKLFVEAARASGIPEAAVQTLEIARDHYANAVPVLDLLGDSYQEMGRTRDARECFEKVCQITPNDHRATKKLKDAMALDSMATDGWSQTAAAGGTYREMIEDEKEAVLLEQEAKAVKTERDIDALIEDVKARIEREPGNINYYRELSRLYVQRVLFDDAVAVLETALAKSSGDPEVASAISLTRAARFDHEIRQLKAAGDEAGAEAKEQEKAQFLFDDLQERVSRYPNDLDLRFQLGTMLINNDYVKEAIQQFQLSQRSPKLRTESLYYLALCFKEKRQYDLALEQLSAAAAEVLTMDATRKKILYELGQVCELTGDTQKAGGYYKQIYQADIGYRDVADKIEKLYG